jgi:predicted O-linked N-acetylglucosamine transferase (SPINDLY family)
VIDWVIIFTGKANEALFHYEKAMPFYDLDAGIRNNYGALLGTLNKKEEEVYWLQEALKIDPNMTHALVNLVGYYQDEGILPKAVEYLSKAISLEPGNHMLALRKALIMSPVLISWRDMIKERNAATAAVLNHNSHLRKNPITKMALDSSLDRIHFYVVYHGVNDRYLQELIIEAYHLLLKNIDFLSPSLWNYQQQQFAALKSSYPLISTLDLFQIQIRPALLQAGSSLSYPTKGQGQLLYTPPRKIRIGFISKFFGIFEPHAMLLDGIMNYLPRNQYTIIVLPVARTDVKPIHPTLVDSSDMIVEISLQSEHALQILSGLQLDILVFADTMSEPITHFLAHSRVASVQVIDFDIFLHSVLS